VQLNRRTRVTFDEDAIVKKFGVRPASIPDCLALVGDAADGYPSLRGWGTKSTAAVLAKFGVSNRSRRTGGGGAWTFRTPHRWRGRLASDRDLALPFRTLATLRTDIVLFADVDELKCGRGYSPRGVNPTPHTG